MSIPITLLQLTDTHIYADDSRFMRGVNTFQTLSDVVELAKASEKDTDLVVLTGDLSQDETLQSYDRLAGLVSTLEVPIYFLPGNHDDRLNMASSFGDYVHFNGVTSLVLGEWLLVFLNSTIPGRVEGELSESELARLDELLINSKGFHVLLFVHHNPIEMRPDRPDPIMLLNARELFTRIESNTHVKGIVWGHVHQEYTGSRDGVTLMATPSTCVQFRNTDTGITIDNVPPGYRRILLYPDGRIETAVNRLKELPAGLQLVDGDIF
ncbi:MAG: metallophosphoesterase [Cyanobacteria bacterium]|nr:metallophosphoesterase [Cyanobacteriota bacterium]